MDFTEVYSDTCSSVSKAIRMGNFDLCKKLIEKGLPVDARDNRGWESLHVAASCGQAECLKLILRQDDVNIEGRTFEEESALFLACQAGKAECVRVLCEAGANPNANTKEFYSPLHEASSNSVECVRLLLMHGARIDSQTFTLDTPLHIAAEYGQFDVMACLLEHGADMTLQNEPGLTPLFITCHRNYPDCLLLLINHAKKQGGKVEEMLFNPAYDQATPLYIAAQEGYYKCVEILLEHGEDPNTFVPLQQQDDLGIAIVTEDDVPKLTALQIAMVGKHIRSIKLLLPVTELGMFAFNVYDMKNSRQFHPIQIASRGSHDVMELLLSYGTFADMCSNGRWINYLPDVITGDLKPLIVLLKTNLFHMESNHVITELCCHTQGFRALLNNGLESLESVLLLLRIGGMVHPQCMHNFSQPVQCAIIKSELGRMKKHELDGVLDSGHQFYLSGRYVLSEDRERDKLSKKNRPYIWLCVKANLNFQTPKCELAGMDTLAHICRRRIVLNQIPLGHYTPEFISQLQIPEVLQDFLLYGEHEWSVKFLQSFMKVEEAERRLNVVLDELDNECHIPRSVAQSLHEYQAD